MLITRAGRLYAAVHNTPAYAGHFSSILTISPYDCSNDLGEHERRQ